MEYTASLDQAWSEITKLTQENHTLRFLGDEYSIDLSKKQVFSASCNIPAKPFYSILLLHYLAKKLNGLAPVKEKWMAFQELPGGQGYYSAFKKRVIDTIIRKYGASPEQLLELSERFTAKKTDTADSSVVLEVLAGVPVLINLWRGDEEFSPSANVLFDQSIKDIFCTEDVVVLAEIVAHSL
ncbi:MAG: DUF3786 domain-containing protein [Candidatus Omnitrophica bacterium]|nr:DUF3786 domain-containing protein [Candidatus Omnitrophota bacterium]